MKPLLFTLGLSLSLIMGGCAVSPQSVVLYPQATLTGPLYGQGRTMTIQVEDRRSSSVLGSRGGIYETSSVISISNDISAALLAAAQKATSQLGFNGSSSSGSESAELSGRST